MKTQGIVQATKQRENNYSIRINDDWFGGFGKCEVSKGQNIEVEFEQNGKFKNIKAILPVLETAKEYHAQQPKLTIEESCQINKELLVKAKLIIDDVFKDSKMKDADEAYEAMVVTIFLSLRKDLLK